MKYNELQLTQNRSPRRVGRGISAGGGKTAGRGTKGQGSRKSGGVRPGFAGGQTPLYMQLPKLRGFKSKRTPAEVVYTGQLDKLSVAVNNDSLFKAGLIGHPFGNVKLVVRGEVTTKKQIKLQGASAAAIAMVEKAGGSFEKVERQARQPKKADKTSV